MLLVVGLGNPGSQYAKHRHNVGFLAVDAIHRRHGFGPWRRRFHGEISEATIDGVKVLLLKPGTYMNDSGRSVQGALTFYKLAPADLLVIHDEVDLPPGKTRMKLGGGAAGHNGLRSIDAAIGDGYRRLRIGVGHPGVKDAVPHYVLHDFSKADAAWLDPLIAAIADNFALIAAGKDPTFANRLHAATQPEKAPPAEAAGDETPKEDKPARTGEPAPKSGGEGPLAGALKKLFGR